MATACERSAGHENDSTRRVTASAGRPARRRTSRKKKWRFRIGGVGPSTPHSARRASMRGDVIEPLYLWMRDESATRSRHEGSRTLDVPSGPGVVHLDSTVVVANVQVLNIPLVSSRHFSRGP